MQQDSSPPLDLTLPPRGTLYALPVARAPHIHTPPAAAAETPLRHGRPLHSTPVSGWRTVRSLAFPCSMASKHLVNPIARIQGVRCAAIPSVNHEESQNSFTNYSRPAMGPLHIQMSWYSHGDAASRDLEPSSTNIKRDKIPPLVCSLCFFSSWFVTSFLDLSSYYQLPSFIRSPARPNTDPY
jgi:hypothetical protein